MEIVWDCIYRDEDTDGNPCWIAVDPMRPGCMSDGETPEEARANLADARVLYDHA